MSPPDDIRHRTVDLLQEYRDLTDSQAAEIRTLRLEVARLQTLLGDEIKALAIYVRESQRLPQPGSLASLVARPVVDAPPPAPVATAAPTPTATLVNYGTATCSKGPHEFTKTGPNQKVCKACRSALAQQASARRGDRAPIHVVRSA